MTQSKGSVLWRRVSQPSYQAPEKTNLVLSWIAGLGLMRLEASANHSSEQARIWPPRVADVRSKELLGRSSREGQNLIVVEWKRWMVVVMDIWIYHVFMIVKSDAKEG